MIEPSIYSIKIEASNKDNKDVSRRFDEIMDYIINKYGVMDNTWTVEKLKLVYVDVSTTFSIQPFNFKQDVPECSAVDKKEIRNDGIIAEIYNWITAKYGEGF